jgi:hypothetical protein
MGEVKIVGRKIKTVEPILSQPLKKKEDKEILICPHGYCWEESISELCCCTYSSIATYTYTPPS